MGSRKRFVVLAAVVGIALGSLSGIDPAGAAKAVAAGNVQCTVNGSLKYLPPLTATAKPTTTSITANLKCTTGQTGTSRVVTGGKLTATSTSVMTSCASRNIAEVNGAVRWKARGGAVEPSAVHLGAGASATSFRFTTTDITGPSYAHHALETQGTLSPQACGKLGVRKAALRGTLDVAEEGANCESDVLTGKGVVVGTDSHLWNVVAPFCDYDASTHPTGTMTYRLGGGPSECLGRTNVPIVDSGVNYAFTPWGPPHAVPFTYWGVDTGLTLGEYNTLCVHDATGVVVHYSGDSRYRPF
jgi:hypothetical protein